MENVIRNLVAFRLAVLRLFTVAFVVTILLSFFMVRTIVTPLNKLSSAAVNIRVGGGRRQVIPDETGRKDEIGDLSGALIKMTDALWEVWCDGMEVSQFTYFQQVGGIECFPVCSELTYGLERLAMYIQGVENVYDLDFNGHGVKYREVFHQNEVEYSKYNFEYADTEMLLRHFNDAERECRKLLADGIALPAYDQCIKASHLFNLLDARGVISVTERAAYIGRVRALAKGCCEGWLKSRGHGTQEA